MNMENVTRIYSVYDMGAEMYGPFFESVNDSVAARNYLMLMKKIDERFHKDYKLFYMGEYNQKTGEILPESPPVEVFVPRTPVEKIDAQNKITMSER